MFPVSQQQRDNAIEALTVMWPTVPKENVAPGLLTWRMDNRDTDSIIQELNPPTCGSIACFGGWCQWWPSFRQQYDQKYYWSMFTTARQLFGDGSLFEVRHSHEADGKAPHLDDHALVSYRLKWLIQNSYVV